MRDLLLKFREQIMFRTYLTLVVVTVALFGCNATHTANYEVSVPKPFLTSTEIEFRNQLIGKWYGNQPNKKGGTKEWIKNNRIDGTYEIQFKNTSSLGEVRYKTETGDWGVSGNIYFSIYRGYVYKEKFHPSDPRDPYNYDAFNIILLNENQYEYVHVTTSNRYLVKRVSDDFEF